MTVGEKVLAMKIKKLSEQGGRCEVCGKLVTLESCQLAHRVPNTKHNRKVYGEAIHHELNLACVCSLKCNSAVLLNIATRPVEAKDLLDKIRRSYDD